MFRRQALRTPCSQGRAKELASIARIGCPRTAGETILKALPRPLVEVMP
jgi:hypothetical protein